MDGRLWNDSLQTLLIVYFCRCCPRTDKQRRKRYCPVVFVVVFHVTFGAPPGSPTLGVPQKSCEILQQVFQSLQSIQYSSKNLVSGNWMLTVSPDRLGWPLEMAPRKMLWSWAEKVGSQIQRTAGHCMIGKTRKSGGKDMVLLVQL
jgi:hypothetical protein